MILTAATQSSEKITAQVREMAEFVAVSADHIAINYGQIDTYTAALLKKYPVVTGLDAGTHFVSEASPAATAAFVMALDTVNFGSGWFAAAQKAGVALEYTVISGCLKRAFATGSLNTPAKWSEATPADCHDIFGMPRGASPELDGLMALFAEHLQTAGQMLVKHYGGEVQNLLEAAGYSAPALAGIVAAWPTFADISQYKGVDVPIYKRAQILAADMHLALGGFSGMEDLTSFADNMVPHVLRHGGILEYTPALAATIDSGVMIEQGAPEEVELRACGIHAVELMKQSAVKQGYTVTAVNIDHILWNRGYEADIYAKPTHKTMTVWY
ncbi:MAG: queuosine salvage family protein [Alphaproteobacteria bacterium]